jgi:hypothetical protein
VFQAGDDDAYALIEPLVEVTELDRARLVGEWEPLRIDAAAAPTRGTSPRRAAAAGKAGIDVIIGYLWGRPAEAAIAAVTRRGPTQVAPRVRHVQLGQATGPTITLRADVLRSSGLEIVGSDASTVPVSGIMKAIPEFMALAASGELPIEVAEVSLADVESAWQRVDHGRRIVFRP